MFLTPKTIQLRNPNTNELVPLNEAECLSYERLDDGYQCHMVDRGRNWGAIPQVYTVQLDNEQALQTIRVRSLTIDANQYLQRLFYVNNAKGWIAIVRNRKTRRLQYYAGSVEQLALTNEMQFYEYPYQSRTIDINVTVQDFALAETHFAQVNGDNSISVFDSVNRVHQITLPFEAKRNGITASIQWVSDNRLYILSQRNQHLLGSIYCVQTRTWLIQGKIIYKIQNTRLNLLLDEGLAKETFGAFLLENGFLLVREPDDYVCILIWDKNDIQTFAQWPHVGVISKVTLLARGDLILQETSNLRELTILRLAPTAFGLYHMAIPFGVEYWQCVGDVVLARGRCLPPNTGKVLFYTLPPLTKPLLAVKQLQQLQVQAQARDFLLVHVQDAKYYAEKQLHDCIENLYEYGQHHYVPLWQRQTIAEQLAFFQVVLIYQLQQKKLVFQAAQLPGAMAIFHTPAIESTYDNLLRDYLDNWAYYVLAPEEYKHWKQTHETTPAFPSLLVLMSKAVDHRPTRVQTTYADLPVELKEYIATFLDWDNLLQKRLVSRLEHSIAEREMRQRLQHFTQKLPIRHTSLSQGSIAQWRNLALHLTNLTSESLYSVVNALHDGRLSAEVLTVAILTQGNVENRRRAVNWLEKLYRMDRVPLKHYAISAWQAFVQSINTRSNIDEPIIFFVI